MLEENTRPMRDWSTLSLSVEFCVISSLSSEAKPTAIFLAIAKPEVGGEGGDKGGESQFSSVPESSSPTKMNFSHVQWAYIYNQTTYLFNGEKLQGS